jgi:hypothetical protein
LFDELSAGTRKQRGAILKGLEDKNGDIPYAAIKRSDVEDGMMVRTQIRRGQDQGLLWPSLAQGISDDCRRERRDRSRVERDVWMERPSDGAILHAQS